jgi:hypothetical protein
MKPTRNLATVVFAVLLLASAAAGADVKITLAVVKPGVQIRANEKAEWKDVDKEAALTEGMGVKTDKSGVATIKWLDGNTLKLSPLTSVALKKIAWDKKKDLQTSNIELSQGRALAGVKKFNNKDSVFTIKTPTALSGVRGTVFEVSLDENNTTHVAAVEDQIFVNAMDVEITVAAGFETSVEPDQPPAVPEVIPPERLEELKQETGEVIETDAQGEAPGENNSDDQAAEDAAQQAQDAADQQAIDDNTGNIDNSDGYDPNCCP